MSNFIVSARKYRPVRFDDVVGQEHVSQTLKNALKNEHLAHAFLFCGPRGVGKTTCARILAKVLNCQNVSADFEPCNECSSCQSFNANSSFNITELDAASNNSVEHIRALIEQVRFQPQQGKYKVFIIDEVHMLSQQAFNAFLKTLEEPPPYAIFILATTEKHKIIPTILSRCQIFDFRRIQVPEMVAHLQAICAEENIEADKDALHIIGQKADGALRDALSIFDRIVAFSGNRISYEDVIANLNVLDYDYYFQVVDALLVEDSSKILLLFDTILRNGFEPDIFMSGLAEHLRNLLVCKDAVTLQLLEVTEGLRARYLEQARLTPSSLLLTALNLANDCDVNYKLARNKRLHVEMALIKMAYIPRAFQLAENGANAFSPEKKTAELSAAPETGSRKLEATVGSPAPRKEVGVGSRKSEVGSDRREPRTDEGGRGRKPETQQPTTSGPHLAQEPSKTEISSPSPPAVNPQPEPEPPRTLSLQGKQPEPEPQTLKKIGKQHTPKLLGLEAMLAEVKAEEAELLTQEVQEVTQKRVEEAWNLYIEAQEQESVKVIMRNSELKLDGQNVAVTVTSALAENTIRQESSLMDYMREVLTAPELTMTIEIDKSKAVEPPKRKRMLSSKDKYLAMREVNPNITELQKRFDLRPDE
ncbi:MAG: DNA polymerase III subunit gamma/tau [Lewinellaceae bacterium]|nr:DNA polymerase III subunit gamma/tau [Phaeodactylibacter sp.]MCB9039845.1 DNA polymerase III subunit gamma/tau [Lewinellaceae bacterium]